MVDESVRQWEPHHALFGGADGLDAIRRLVADAPRWLRRGGWLVLEIGADQGPAVADLFTDLGYRDVEIRPDLAARDRVGIGRVAPEPDSTPHIWARMFSAGDLGADVLEFENQRAQIEALRRLTEPNGDLVEEGAFLGRHALVGADELAGGGEQRHAQNSARDATVDVVQQLVDGAVGVRLARRRHRLAEVLLVRERRAAPILRELTQHAELVVAEVLIGQHHDGEQLERGHVLAVGGGVDGDAFVQLFESPRLVHHPGTVVEPALLLSTMRPAKALERPPCRTGSSPPNDAVVS